MTGFQSKKAAALDEDGMYLVHHTAQQDATMQSLKDLKRSVCNEVGKAAFDTIKLPEQSEWKCYMFGNTPQDNQGILYIPRKGKEPNWFVRWMMKVCFACTWEKNNG
jgi:hypothetical protein